MKHNQFSAGRDSEYLAPKIEILDISVEQGFAATTANLNTEDLSSTTGEWE